MTDLEMTKLCAEAMGLPFSTGVGLWQDGRTNGYDPLHDDAQAMALVKHVPLDVRYTNQWIVSGWYQGKKTGMAIQEEARDPTDLNRAIVECVARMRRGKEA